MIRFELLEIPFEVVTKYAPVWLLTIAPWMKYESGKRTDIQQGFMYTVVDTATFEKYVIKIKGTTPLLTDDQLASAKERIAVKFEEAICKPYKNASGNYELSITAKGISIAK
jgi:hypothetical protein